MTDTTQASAPAAVNAIDKIFATIKADFEVVEGDVIALCQNIEAGIEVAAEDLTYSLSWLGSHIGEIANTVTAVQNSANSLTAAGVILPPSLVSGISQINQAVAGVNSALNNQAVTADAATALKDGYSATKALQVAAASAASIAAAVQAATAPAPAPAVPPAS